MKNKAKTKVKAPAKKTGANPLLQDSTLPHGTPPFDRIREEHYLPALKQAIAKARKNIAAIKKSKAAPDFENTLVALETASEDLGVVTGIFYNQLSAAGTDGLQTLAGKIGPISADFSNDILLDEALFARVKAVHDKKTHKPALTTEQKTLLEESYKGFVRGGALLNGKKKKRLREISQRLSVLGPTFMNNVKKSAEKFELVIADKKDLAGLPESATEGARHAAEEKGYKSKWLFTLDFPSYGPFMQFSDNRALREKIWRAFGSRAWGDEFDNNDIVIEIVRLRDERAKLLGYKNHATFVLEQRMAEKPETVMKFLEKINKAYKPAALKDLKNLQDFAKKIGGPSELKPWDVGYYSEKLRQKLFDFSSEDLRPYFPLENVLTGCFTHFSKLFGLKFKASKAYPVWHPDVTAYDVFDEKSGRFVGVLYADFFPRTGKKDGAWKTSYRDQGLFHGRVERPIVAIVCNFTKPAGERPSLLTHDEVLTLFHEMGHAVHALLSDVTYSSLAGTNVKWDFVELPSQVQENWLYEKETLDLVSGHYKTGKKIPADLIDKLIASKNYMVGWAGLRQVNFGVLDMAWHTADPSKIKNVAAFEDKVTADTTLFTRMAGPQSTAFSHLFAGGYSAGYYSYKWAEVLDADTFELFLDKGLYDRKTADAYKREVLSRGGSEHPRVLYKRFRGRDADPDALLRREGLLETKAA
jgi:peptidyl-dipeptidase Dcp